ncbi:hypothetical protein K0M31_009775 [Melipona bicolor]|uniref:Uncharacterized protein n=1 Tax=Melipona bicolor TaxID=60889 RepID=A0AA40FNB6_9HYME|nr:hypothetical protein K0M31_009775 [Melipona bicolor]
MVARGFELNALDSFGDGEDRRWEERGRGRPVAMVDAAKEGTREKGVKRKRERRGIAKSVADWRPKARLQIPGVMPVIRGFGAQ